jgi:hypothetical protein
MPHFYVSTSAGKTGTRTTGGGDVSARTGAFSAMADGDVYATIALAFVDGSAPPVAGDIIRVANDHAFTQSAASQNWGTALDLDTPVEVYSMLETDCTVYSAGAKETIDGGGFDIVLRSKAVFRGIDAEVDDDFNMNGSGYHISFDDCTLTLRGSTDALRGFGDGSYWGFKDTTIVWTGGTSSPCWAANKSNIRIQMDNCIIQNGSGTLAHFFGQAADGGLTARLNNCDFSEIAGYILANHGNNSVADDNIDIRMAGCKMNATADPFVEEVFLSIGQYFLATNCSDVAAEAEYQFYQKSMAGIVRDTGDDGTAGGVYRVESTAFSDGNKVSYKVATSASCSEGAPMVFEMPARLVDLTDAAENELTFYIAQLTADSVNMTTANSWIEIAYPDATNKQLWTTVSSRAADIFSATGLTADGGSSDWEDNGTDLTTYDELKILLATTGDPGAICVPRITFHCTIPSITFFVDTGFDLS